MDVLVTLILLLVTKEGVTTSYYEHLAPDVCVTKGQQWVQNQIGGFSTLRATFQCQLEGKQ